MIEERSNKFYKKYIGTEFVLTDRKDKKIMGKFRKRIKYDDIITEEGQYNFLHNKYVYE